MPRGQSSEEEFFLMLEFMIVQRGITSFFDRDRIGNFPEFTFAEFKSVVWGVASSLRFPVSEWKERGLTPNFHSARLDRGENSIAILGHATYPIVAFSELWTENHLQLRFVDCPVVKTELRQMFPHVSVADSGELMRKLRDSDLLMLDRVERDQVKYWKPQTVGEIAFNWWD